MFVSIHKEHVLYCLTNTGVYYLVNLQFQGLMNITLQIRWAKWHFETALWIGRTTLGRSWREILPETICQILV